MKAFLKSFRNPLVILRIGLALVFLSNSLTAYLNPDDFREIIDGSFLHFFVGNFVSSFIYFICLSDGLVAVLLLLNIKLRWTSAYALLWILGVTLSLISSAPLDALEHAGFLAMAGSLFLSETKKVSA